MYYVKYSKNIYTCKRLRDVHESYNFFSVNHKTDFSLTRAI